MNIASHFGRLLSWLLASARRLKRVFSNPVGLCLLVLIPLLTGAWAGWVSIQKADRLRMAKEIGSDREFWGAAMPNKANTRMFFAQQTESGLALYMRDEAGHEELIYEEPEIPAKKTLFQLLEWSPDDQHFAYVRETSRRMGGVEIILCRGTDGSRAAKVNVQRGLFGFAWLSPSAYVYLNSVGQLRLVEFQEDRWQESKVFKNLGAGPKRELTALSSRSVAWANQGAIWRFALDEDRPPQKIWESETNSLVNFFFSRETERFLVNCRATDERRHYLFSFSRYEPLRELGGIGRAGDFVAKVSWINNEKGYAYLVSNLIVDELNPRKPYRNHTLFVKPDADAVPIRVLGTRETLDYTLVGNRLYPLSSSSHEPSSIWEYDPASAALQCLVEGAPAPRHSKRVITENRAITNGLGDEISYHLWPPARFNPGKKYPVIITQTPYRWYPEPQVAANCGYYFAAAPRKNWWARVGKYSDDVMAVYEDLLKNPNIDTNRVFLFGISAETSSISALLARHPNLWKGAILQSPSGLPDLSRIQTAEILIIGAKDEEGALERLSNFQNDAARLGLPVRVVFRDGPHIGRAVVERREHAVHLAAFLSER